jgi:hypothetical protein
MDTVIFSALCILSVNHTDFPNSESTHFACSVHHASDSVHPSQGSERQRKYGNTKRASSSWREFFFRYFRL